MQPCACSVGLATTLAVPLVGLLIALLVRRAWPVLVGALLTAAALSADRPAAVPLLMIDALVTTVARTDHLTLAGAVLVLGGLVALLLRERAHRTGSEGLAPLPGALLGLLLPVSATGSALVRGSLVAPSIGRDPGRSAGLAAALGASPVGTALPFHPASALALLLAGPAVLLWNPLPLAILVVLAGLGPLGLRRDGLRGLSSLLVLAVLTGFLLWLTGHVPGRAFTRSIAMGDPALALLGGAGLSLFHAAVLARLEGRMPLAESLPLAWAGARGTLPLVGLLVLAWSVAELTPGLAPALDGTPDALAALGLAAALSAGTGSALVGLTLLAPVLGTDPAPWGLALAGAALGEAASPIAPPTLAAARATGLSLGRLLLAVLPLLGLAGGIVLLAATLASLGAPLALVWAVNLMSLAVLAWLMRRDQRAEPEPEGPA